MRWVVRVLAVMALALTNASAQAPKRVALVIANSTYTGYRQLPNTAVDAGIVTAALQRAGFDVEQRGDLGIAGMRTALGQFQAKAAGADVALVYYAGHGLEAGGKNWLIPTDAKLGTDAELDFQAIEANLVIRAASGARARIVVLDACRDNPFAGRMRSTGVYRVTRATGGGLSALDVQSARGTLLMYSAAPGEEANDGAPGQGSPFARAFARWMPEPGVELRVVAGKIADAVFDETRRTQLPFTTTSLSGTEIYLVPRAGGAAIAAPTDPVMQHRAEEAERRAAAMQEEMARQHLEPPSISPSDWQAELPSATPARLRAIGDEAMAAWVRETERPLKDRNKGLVALKVFIEPQFDADPRSTQARENLLRTAGRLGDELRGQTSNSQIELAYLNLALGAALAQKRVDPTKDISPQYLRLGEAYMQAAGVAGPPRGCERTVAGSELINKAQNYLFSVESEEGALWRGCAAMAIGDFQRAVDILGRISRAGSADAKLLLGRAALEIALNGGSEQARVLSSNAYSDALTAIDLPGSVREIWPFVDSAYANIRFSESAPSGEKQRFADAAYAQLIRATTIAQESALSGEDVARAHMMLGHLQLGEGAFESKRNYIESKANLIRAISLVSGNKPSERSLRAAAHDGLSRLEMNKHFAGERADLRSAVANGDLAAEEADWAQGADFANRACFTRLAARTLDDNTQSICSAVEARDNRDMPSAYLREGLYFLVVASMARSEAARKPAWEHALSSFDRGEVWEQNNDFSDLRARLVVGKSFAVGCAGLRSQGESLIESIPIDLRPEARKFYENYGIRGCR